MATWMNFGFFIIRMLILRIISLSVGIETTGLFYIILVVTCLIWSYFDFAEDTRKFFNAFGKK